MGWVVLGRCAGGGGRLSSILSLSLTSLASSLIFTILCILTLALTLATLVRAENNIFEEGKSDKEILDDLLQTARYDKRLLPPVQGTLRPPPHTRQDDYTPDLVPNDPDHPEHLEHHRHRYHHTAPHNHSSLLTPRRKAISDVFPKKEQGIIIEAKDGLTIKDYATEIAKLTDPNNIRFISKISNNRVCIFLSSKEIADELTEHHKEIHIQNNILQLRPLISKLKRIIISNVSPVIPHMIIQEALQKLGIPVQSKISFLRAGLADIGFPHVLSFRRQFYINPEDIGKLQDTLLISYEDTSYRIFLATETAECYIYIDAPLPSEADFPPLRNKRPLSSSSKAPSISSTDNCPNTEAKNEATLILKKQEEDDSTTTKQTIKKPKRNQSKERLILSLDQMLLPIKDELSNLPQKYILNYTEFKSLLENCQRNVNIPKSAKEYSDNFDSLIHMISELHPLLKDHSIKIRLTKILKQLKTYEEPPNNEPDYTNNHNPTVASKLDNKEVH
ncbi:hypothetical protein KPH14_012745 [Odynerus spinipes]|uniref:Uncharacterized protein n=1 Tax=Odynerus spinipes TaxID=1348599 RepID=A0AAD9RF91_9HYME|nr:hypothetical protein KPH14_012745 [Odynerus spinipes]